jgi:aminotransferase in exopolysaccharide biosynthesis
MSTITAAQTVQFIRELYGQPEAFIPLHAPHFVGNEKKYLNECIDSTFVSSVGPFVDRFEAWMREYTGAKYAIAVVNGTAALHLSLQLAGVQRDELVVTQALSFIATCNAISYIGAEPCFVDVDQQTLGMSAAALEAFFTTCEIRNNACYHKATGKRVAACVPMHTFGIAAEIDSIAELCARFHVPLVEDAAESLGTTWKGKHTGRFGLLGAYSFNGNKTVTSGGGGIIITDDDDLGKMAKHLSTQAKVPHRWEFVHDHIGYNYRCPNINSALALAQLEQLERYIEDKQKIASDYERFFANSNWHFVAVEEQCRSNNWLNAILLPTRAERDDFLTYTNDHGVMTRPVWELMHRLSMFAHCIHDGLPNSIDIADRLVNLPSSFRP